MASIIELKEKIIVIPGIGGHPEFHKDLIDSVGISLHNNIEIICHPHGDFSSSPFFSMEQHAKYWTRIIKQTTNYNSKTHILGISFGATIIQVLPKDVFINVTSICLVSPPFLPRYARIFLKITQLIDSTTVANVFGKLMFWWSDKSVSNSNDLRELRYKLYDDNSLVYLRLWKRLMALIKLPDAQEFFNKNTTIPVCIIYGENEFLLRLSPFSQSSTPIFNNIKLKIIPGDHSQSVKKSDAINNAINEFLIEVV